MAVLDVSFITYFAPILAFVIVLAIVFAVLNKTEILGKNLFIQWLLAFVVAAVFVAFAGARDYVLTIVPWFGVLIVCAVILLMMMNFAGSPSFIKTGFGVVVVIATLIIFLVSAFFLFSHQMAQYLPGATGGNADFKNIVNWLYSSRVWGAILLIVIGGIVSWILVRSVKK